MSDVLRLEVDNYRALRRVRCGFGAGITVVVGPNGAGKSTLLDVPMLLRNAASRDLVEALDHHGGRVARSWEVSGEDVRLRAHFGPEPEANLGSLTWELRFANEGEQLGNLREQLWLGDEKQPYATFGIGETIGRVGDETFGTLGGGGPVAFDAAERKRLDRAGDFRRVKDSRTYGDFVIHAIKVHGSQYGSDHFLHPTGRNVFTVLRNWRDKVATAFQYDFVVEALRHAFPAMKFLGFEFESAGQVVVGAFVQEIAGGYQHVPVRVAANGVISAVLHLTAVASAPPGGYVGLDEPENALHPFAIRALLDAIEDYAAERHIAVVVATHSPVVLDHFQQRLERVLVRDPSREEGFVPLTQLQDPDYVHHFAIGRMYAQGRYGAPSQ